MKKFVGVWGIFEYLDETTETIEQVREKGIQPTKNYDCHTGRCDCRKTYSSFNNSLRWQRLLLRLSFCFELHGMWDILQI